jgi:hypothetical protein
LSSVVTAGDGLALEIDQPHGPCGMDEYGRTTVEDDPRDFATSPFVGEQLRSVREFRYRDGNLDFAVGITVQFPSGSIRILADKLVLAHDQHLGPVENSRGHLRTAQDPTREFPLKVLPSSEPTELPALFSYSYGERTRNAV